MKRILTIYLALFSTILLSQNTYIQCGKLIDTKKGKVHSNKTIIVSKDRIIDVKNGFITSTDSGDTTIDLTNATEDPVTFTFQRDGSSWLTLPPSTTVQSGETKKVSFGPSGDKALNGKRRRKKDYNGNVKVSAAGETITFNYQNKHHKG